MTTRGRVVGLGPSAAAPEFFGVHAAPAIYKVLSKGTPDAWVQKYDASPYFDEYVTARLSEPSPPLPSTVPPSTIASSTVPPQESTTPVTTKAEARAPSPTPKLSLEEELARLKAARKRD